MGTEFNLSEKIGLNEHQFCIHKDYVKEFIKRLKEEFEICRDKTDIWADERWNKFESMFKKKVKELAGDKLISQ